MKRTHLMMIASTISARCIVNKEVRMMQRKEKIGSKVSKATNVNFFRAEYNKLLKDDNFGENLIYSPAHFRRRFWMHHSLFEKILEDLVEANPYFEQKKDALGLVGFSPHQKLNSALRMLAYGTLADQLDDLTRMAASTTLHNLKVFCNSIISRYGTEYFTSSYKG